MLSKDAVIKHFASKNQLPDFYTSGALVENGLNSAQKEKHLTSLLSG